MQIRVQCPACKATFEVPAALVGRDGECSRCLKVFRVAPLSGQVDPAVLASTDSGATLEMPIFDDNRSAPDTDEFDIPDLPAAPVVSSSPVEAELAIPASDIPELDLSEPRNNPPTKRKSAEALPALDVTFKDGADKTPLPDVEDDGSLFDGDIPELEEIREPISRYAAEDEIDPDAGGSYSLAGSPPAREKRTAKTARRKKPQRKSTTPKEDRSAASFSGGETSSGGEASAGKELDVDEVQLFDDVLHGGEDDDADDSSSPILLRRSGTFSSPGKVSKSSGGAAARAAGRQSGKRAAGKKASRELSDADASELTGQPVLKRRSGGGRPAAPAAKPDAAQPRARNKRPPMSAESQRNLLMIAGGGAVLLLLAGAFQWLTSGPPVINPTILGGEARGVSPSPSGPAPVPNQGGDSIQTGETNSSVARANRIRSAPTGPRRVGEATAGEREDASIVSETITSPGKKTSASETSGNDAAAARPPAAPGRSGAASSADVSDGLTNSPASNFQTEDDKLFPVETVPIPKFPRLGGSRASTIAGVVFYEITVGSDRATGPGGEEASGEKPLPGSQMDMILYLPSGSHQPGSLPCIMIAAAGTTLLEGNGCFDESYQSETIPYVKQGFAVLGYSLDGPLDTDSPTNRESKAAYEQFRAAHAGLVNSRNALEFLLQNVPAINRDRIFTAGHSSAGTLSLLFAEHESRLAGCLAYAPCVDVEKRLKEYVANPLVQVLMPEVKTFIRQESPMRHVSSLKCPVFIFHAEGDANAPFDESRQLAARLTAQGTPCQLESIPDGDHYDSMLEAGIPRAQDWLRNIAFGELPTADTPPASQSKTAP
ncbi:MAG: prolyl oligopeptidase family serine peptidase [Rhodopirellula sp.]|nr:prolyl oligopeptidase family serine peptidase [Rhodopirellula sp.]